jgi:hypothetical protein
MAVTKQTYTATATWTAAQLATTFESAFIDAGLMTAWFDSFVSGSVENRVLEITYDGAKAYGKTYYWFQFTTTGAFVALATGWTAGSDVPAGTQYLDYFSTTTNGTGNHFSLLTLVATTAATITRYSSGATSGHAWFTIKQGATFQTFHIVRAGSSRQTWVDLDKVFFNGLLLPTPTVSNNAGAIGWGHPYRLRRDILGGFLRGNTTAGEYGATTRQLPFRYAAWGNANASANNGQTAYVSTTPAIILPNAFSNVNTGYGANVNPVYHSLVYSPYLTSTLPTDIGIAFHYANNTMAHGDVLVVTAASEEWEIIDRANNTTATDGASVVFLARTI